MMKISKALAPGIKLKIGIYTHLGKALYETYWPDEDAIQQVDDTHLVLEIPHSETCKFQGPTTLRAALFTNDRKFVNAGENQIPLQWEPEPVTKQLKY